jgi:lipoate-protein ligase B
MSATGPATDSVVGRPRLQVVDAGLVGYDRALASQRRLAAAKRRGEVEQDFLLIVEHPPVITLGRGTRPNEVFTHPEVIESRAIPCVEIERGGDVTYHGPGQLVGYPILDLGHFRRDLHWYLRCLERAVCGALARFGLRGFRIEGYTGVWVGEVESKPSASLEVAEEIEPERAPALIDRGEIRKIASIGVHASRWITWHGFALNVTDEPLEPFGWIVPCGIDGARMTSLHAEGIVVTRDEVVDAVAHSFAEVFDVPFEWCDGVPLEAGEAFSPRT